MGGDLAVSNNGHRLSASEAAYSVIFIFSASTAAWYGFTSFFADSTNSSGHAQNFTDKFFQGVGNIFLAYMVARIYAVVHKIDQTEESDIFTSKNNTLEQVIERFVRISAFIWVILAFKKERFIRQILPSDTYFGIQDYVGHVSTFFSSNGIFDKMLGEGMRIPDYSRICIDRMNISLTEKTLLNGDIGIALLFTAILFVFWDFSVYLFKAPPLDNAEDEDYLKEWNGRIIPIFPHDWSMWIQKRLFDKYRLSNLLQKLFCRTTLSVSRIFLYIISLKFLDRLSLALIATIVASSECYLPGGAKVLFPLLCAFVFITGIYFHRTFLDDCISLFLSPFQFVFGDGFGRIVATILIIVFLANLNASMDGSWIAWTIGIFILAGILAIRSGILTFDFWRKLASMFGIARGGSGE